VLILLSEITLRTCKIAEMNISDPQFFYSDSQFVNVAQLYESNINLSSAALKSAFSEKWILLYSLHPLFQRAVMRDSILRLQILDMHVVSSLKFFSGTIDFRNITSKWSKYT